MPNQRGFMAQETAWARIAIALVGCGPTEQAQDPADATSSADSSSSAEEIADDTKTTAEQPEPKEVEVNQTIVDEELGYTIVFKQAIVDLPFDNANIWADGYFSTLY